MSTGLAFKLYLDASLERKVLKCRTILLPTQTSTEPTDNHQSRPHITLFSTSMIQEPTRLEPIVKDFASNREPLPLLFPSLGSLPRADNLKFLRVKPLVSLLRFQSQLRDEIKRQGVEIRDGYEDDCWSPYCAIVPEAPEVQLMEAFCLKWDLKSSVTGLGMNIGVVEISPFHPLFSFSLGN